MHEHTQQEKLSSTTREASRKNTLRKENSNKSCLILAWLVLICLCLSLCFSPHPLTHTHTDPYPLLLQHINHSLQSLTIPVNVRAQLILVFLQLLAHSLCGVNIYKMKIQIIALLRFTSCPGNSHLSAQGGFCSPNLQNKLSLTSLGILETLYFMRSKCWRNTQRASWNHPAGKGVGWWTALYERPSSYSGWPRLRSTLKAWLAHWDGWLWEAAIPSGQYPVMAHL